MSLASRVNDLATAVGTALKNRVRYDASQSLNSTQQSQARSNINALVNPTGTRSASMVPYNDDTSAFRWGTVDEVVAAGLGWVIAKGSGIDPTGVADSATALQAKIDAAAAIGTTCWIPAGTYLVTVPLQVKTNVTIMGVGQSTKIVKYSNTADARGINAVITGYLKDNFNISKLRLIGNRTNYAAGNVVTTNGLWLEQCSYFGVSDLRISDCAIGVKSKTCWTCSYVRVTSMRCQGYAFSVTDSSTSHFLQNCTAWGCGGGFELILAFYCTIIDSANDHCSAGGRSDDPFLPEGSGGSYTAASYAFYVNGSTVTMINPGLENGYCQYLYAKDCNVTMINPSISNINCYTPAFDLIGLKGSTSKARVRIINGSGFDTAVNQLTTSSFRTGLRVENADIQFINADMPFNFHSSWGAFAYQGNSVSPTPISGSRTAAPTTGTWAVGDKIENSNLASTGNEGWVCTVAGTPGTWVPYGNLGQTVRYDAAQSLTSTQQAQALANLGCAYVSAGASDQTAALNAWLSDGNASSIKQMVGAFNVSDRLIVPDGVSLDLSRATVTQTAANKILISMGNNTTLRGGRLVGKGTDYVASASPSAFGIDANAVSGVQIIGTKITNVAGPGIRVYGASSDVKIHGCTIVGLGSGTIAAGVGDPCYGVLIDYNSPSRVTITDCDISACCQGIIAGDTVTKLTIANTRIHDIPGQHGIYLQNGTGVILSNLDLRNTYYIGAKLQLSSSSTADSQGTTISNINADSCGDVGLLLCNTATDLTSAKRFRSVTISNVSATNCGRGLYLGSVYGGAVDNVTVYNSSLDAITLIDCQNIEAGRWVVDTCGRVGVRLTLQTGSATDQVAIDGLRIHNAAGANVANNLYGVYHAQGSNVSMSRVKVTANNGFLVYGYYLASSTAGDQTSCSLRNSDFSGDTGTSARFQSPPTTVRAWSSNRFSGTILNKPTGIATTIDVP